MCKKVRVFVVFLLCFVFRPCTGDRISALLILLWITITSISCAHSSLTFLYIKFSSFTMTFFCITWIIATMIVSNPDLDYVFFMIELCFGLLVCLYFFSFCLSVSHDYSNYYFLKKMGVAKKILIPKQDKHLFDKST